RDLLVNPSDENTIFEYPTIFASFAPVCNPGTGLQHMTLSEERWLWATGRAKTGENFIVGTRDPGSATRNASMNFMGLDASFGVGDNIGALQTDASFDQVGPKFFPNGKASTGSLRSTVTNARLGVAYLGAEGGGSTSGTTGFLDTQALNIIDTRNDLYA